MKRLLSAIILSIMLLVPSPASSSQVDFTISTADANTGSTFRAAVNAAIQALASLNSGDSAPPTTYAGMLWYDTLNSVVKIRDSTNTAWNTWWDPALSVTELVPTGSVKAYAGSTAPTGWLLCYGQAVSRATYATLFAVVSTTYGAGDGSTTFNLPDLRGRIVVGLDNMGGAAASRVAAATTLGQAAGAETSLSHTHTGPSHTHSIGAGASHLHSIGFTSYLNGDAMSTGTGAYHVPYYTTTPPITTDAEGAHNHGGATGTEGTGATGNWGSGSTVMNPYAALNYIIRY